MKTDRSCIVSSSLGGCIQGKFGRLSSFFRNPRCRLGHAHAWRRAQVASEEVRWLRTTRLKMKILLRWSSRRVQWRLTGSRGGVPGVGDAVRGGRHVHDDRPSTAGGASVFSGAHHQSAPAGGVGQQCETAKGGGLPATVRPSRPSAAPLSSNLLAPSWKSPFCEFWWEVEFLHSPPCVTGINMDDRNHLSCICILHCWMFLSINLHLKSNQLQSGAEGWPEEDSAGVGDKEHLHHRSWSFCHDRWTHVNM